MINLNIAVVQNNTFTSNLLQNTENLLKKIALAKNANLIVTQELAICGKNPQDLLLTKNFMQTHQECVESIIKASCDTKAQILLGALQQENNKLYNTMLLIHNGKIKSTFYKAELESNSPFNESNYFAVKNSAVQLTINNQIIDIVLDCNINNIENFVSQSSNFVLFVKTIPYNKNHTYQQEIKEQALKIQKNILHVNSLGYENGFIFAGNVTLYNKENIKELNEPFAESVIYLKHNKEITTPSKEAELYNAICFGFTNYMQQNGFTKAIFGLSGGIDSAFCSVLACDCLGSENVYTYMLPSAYTSASSLEDAKEIAFNLSCKYKVIPIKNIVKESTLQISNAENDVTLTKLALENIQSRIRANVLMALCNSLSGSILIATGNKSEIATGFCTLYGDTCGALAPIGDILKTELYELANWRNKHIPRKSLLQKNNVIPKSIINKAPSAELHENQKDEDRLPAYNKLDKAITTIMEENLSYNEMLKQVDQQTLDETILLITRNEFKRKLMPSVIKVSKKSFLPNEWKFGLMNKINIIGR